MDAGAVVSKVRLVAGYKEEDLSEIGVLDAFSGIFLLHRCE